MQGSQSVSVIGWDGLVRAMVFKKIKIKEVFHVMDNMTYNQGAD